MKKLSTKQRILEAALTLFAEKGFEAVRVAQIAEAVGIKAPSLYKHFKSKQEIFEGILKEMAGRYKNQVTSVQMDGVNPHRDAEYFMEMEEAQLIQIGKSLFHFFLHDEYAGKYRRMLAVEQYHNPKLAALYAQQYVEDPLSFQGAMFGIFTQSGSMLPENPQIMALHFYAPLFLLLTLCDCQPAREAEAIAMLELHISQFNRLYRKKEAF